jgi:hypothetical protein
MLLTKLSQSKLYAPYAFYSKMAQNKAIISLNLKGYVDKIAVEDYLISLLPCLTVQDEVLFNMVLHDLRIRMRGVSFI